MELGTGANLIECQWSKFRYERQKNKTQNKL